MRNWRHYTLALLVGAGAGLVVLAGQVGVQNRQGTPEAVNSQEAVYTELPGQLPEYFASPETEVYAASNYESAHASLPENVWNTPERQVLVDAESLSALVSLMGFAEGLPAKEETIAPNPHNDTRLVLYHRGRGEAATMDSNGCVRWNRKKWHITRRAFVLLYGEISRQKHKRAKHCNEIKAGQDPDITRHLLW